MSGVGDPSRNSRGLRRGDVVAVRSLDEIVATLDADAKFEGVPFMPEMTPFCGKTFRVHRRAEKTCVEGVGMRSLQNTVLLEDLRCDGSDHDGCQRGCLFFWKEAWLKQGAKADASPINEPAAVQSIELPTTRGGKFYCQSTELLAATSDFAPGKWRHYLRDFWIGEITLRRFAAILWRSLTNRVWRRLQGHDFYQIAGEQKKTVSADLNLQPGEWVEVKSLAEIQATLDPQGRNRGLSFEPEMALYCGRRYRVAAPVQKIIVERTGEMARLGNTVILDGIVCQGLCSMNCPRANYLYWREIWLKRV